ncbi:putative Fe-S cluster assembly protein SufT [Thalassotalea sp. 42_200_T64]|nr:putative Fe-S cluster assembly protein SufT [Thalassotalea sp. 42_200_T64]
MQFVEHVTVLRNCDAIVIPAGITVTLNKGREVVITQALGGSYTVNDNGQLLRVASQDADALGKADIPKNESKAEFGKENGVNLVRIYEQLSTCYDPEIPINIVELGLVYDVNCYELLDGRHHIRITMTLTSAGCGMGTVLAEDIRVKCLNVANVDVIEVIFVYDPPWQQDMMSEAAKLQLGLL